MHDLATLKRINRNPSSNGQDKPAPQPARHESDMYDVHSRLARRAFRAGMQSPAMEREPLGDA